MRERRSKGLLQKAAILGATSATVYVLHVVIGGILWDGYSNIEQTISELTGSGAPYAGELRILTVLYGVLALAFSVVVYMLFEKYNVYRTARLGSILLVLMHFTSLFGYALFPLEDNGAVLNMNNMMHLAVTAAIVILTIAAIFSIGIGLLKTKYFKAIGIFTLACGIVLVLSGAATPFVLSNGIPIAGLVERINIFTLQLWIFVLSIFLYRIQLPKKAGLDLKRMGLVDVYGENYK
ncbi:DUF998 domain-containing protein [Planococcus sp. FY231025]|uniref:DUF998 domain-containing protein n=1 Tax=Planococcus sp. FY231025 TaxID=3455699 RepID=UPI003F93B3E2